MANYTFIDSTGVIIPDTSTLKSDVQQEFRDALGQDLDVADNTPQGTLISAEVTSRQSVAANNAAVANQINPNLAGGIFLDAVCALTGLQRSGATYSTVAAALLTGIPGTLVPQGVRARTVGGDIFASMGAVTLGADGTATVNFQAVETGAITAPINTLNEIIDVVLGWETINNPVNAAKLGRAQQSDISLRTLRKNTLAKQTISTREAQISGLYALPNVHSLQFRENIANTVQVIDGITMQPHSVWACVRGGTDSDIAYSLLKNKTDGAGWNGVVTINVTDPASGQIYPVQFDRPTDVPIEWRVTVRNVSYRGDIVTDIPAAIEKWADGEMPSQQGLVTGVDATPWDASAAVVYFCPGLHVLKVECRIGGSTVWGTSNIPISLQQCPTTTQGLVSVIVS